MPVARAGLVANSVPAGMPAAAHQSRFSVQDAGRYSARSINAGPVDQRRTGRGCVGEVDRDLGVLDPADGVGVLPLPTDRMHAFFRSPISSTNQHRAGVAQVVNHETAQVVPH